MAHLAAGLCVGCGGLVSGICIGTVADAAIRAIGYRSQNISVIFSLVDVKSDSNDNGYIADKLKNNSSGHASSTPLKLAPWGREVDDDEVASGRREDQNKLFVGMMIMLIFSEALALYGLITALIVSQHSYECI